MLEDGGNDRPAWHERLGTQSLPAVSFPYGFPSVGRYRIFIHVNHGATVETGPFDTEAQ